MQAFHPWFFFTHGVLILLQESINGGLEVIDRFFISVLHRVDDAVGDVLADDDLAERADRGADGRELDEHIRAVLVPLDHVLHFVQMPDDPGQTVDNTLFVFRRVVMGVYFLKLFVHNASFRFRTNSLTPGKESVKIIELIWNSAHRHVDTQVDTE